MTRKGALRVGDYLGHMLDAIRQIERYVEGLSEADFLEDRKTQDAVIRNFEILGEAARNVESAAPEFAAAHAEVPWGDAYRLRNQVAHGYFSVDLNVVWQTIRRDLPGLKARLSTLLDSLA